MKLARCVCSHAHRAGTLWRDGLLATGTRCCSSHIWDTSPCRHPNRISSRNVKSSTSSVFHCTSVRASLSTSAEESNQDKIKVKGSGLLESSDHATRTIAEKDFVVIEDFVTEEEEATLLKEVERFLKKTRYEYDHWDNAIHGFRETEKSKWTDSNSAIIQRIRDTAFPACAAQLSLVHVLDLAQNGYIKPHVDSIKFCGDTIAGLCLISPAIMRLVHTEDQQRWVNALLNPRSLYIMRGQMRYDYTHEVLKDEESVFKGDKVPRGRRISIMCRSEVSS